MMSKLNLSKNNQFNGMEREDFKQMLKGMGFEVEDTDGVGSIVFDEEETKGRMKISRTEAPTKSKHKHDYYPVLIVHTWDDHNHYSAGVKCSICGHVKWNEELFNKLTNTKFPFLGFDDEHFQEQYRGLEITKDE